MTVITTLPIAPNDEPNIMFFLSQFLADVLSELTGNQLILPFNILGVKQAIKAAQLDNHLNILSRLGINPQQTWIDSLNINQNLAQKACDFLYWHNIVQVLPSQILFCECGKLEMLKNSEHGVNGKVYEVKENKTKCKICGSQAKTKNVSSLMLSVPSTPLKVFPQEIRKRAEESIKEISSRKWRISRIRKTGFQVCIENQFFYLDIDFLWMLYSLDLLNKSYAIDTLVASTRTLRKAIIFCQLALLFGINIEKLVLHPYVKLINSNSNQYNMVALLNRYGRDVCRLFLAHGLMLGNLECELSSSEFFWILKSIDILCNIIEKLEINNNFSIEKILQNIIAQQTKTTLSKIRKDPSARINEDNLISIKSIMKGCERNEKIC